MVTGFDFWSAGSTTPYTTRTLSGIRKLFAREIFDHVFEVKVLCRDWRHKYNHRRAHSSLGYLPPALFAARLTTPEPSLRVDH